MVTGYGRVSVCATALHVTRIAWGAAVTDGWIHKGLRYGWQRADAGAQLRVSPVRTFGGFPSNGTAVSYDSSLDGG